MNQGAGLVGGLFALSEKYPNLSADQNYASFMKELIDTEDRIALARRLLQRQPACGFRIGCLPFPTFWSPNGSASRFGEI